MPMTLLPLLLGFGACFATLCGGTLALWLGSRIALVLGFAAGAVIGVALFDLLPEALELAGTTVTQVVFVAMAAGFGGYMALDRLLDAVHSGGHGHAHLGAASLTVHSTLDGLGIGLAFQASPQIGLVVAAAVLAHDASDGINTVSVSLGFAGTEARRIARRWLVADALAPVLGVLLSYGLHVPRTTLAPLLALFAGAFLYIGAAQLVPRSYALHPRFFTTGASIAGMVVIYLAVTLSG